MDLFFLSQNNPTYSPTIIIVLGGNQQRIINGTIHGEAIADQTEVVYIPHPLDKRAKPKWKVLAPVSSWPVATSAALWNINGNMIMVVGGQRSDYSASRETLTVTFEERENNKLIGTWGQATGILKEDRGFASLTRTPQGELWMTGRFTGNLFEGSNSTEVYNGSHWSISDHRLPTGCSMHSIIPLSQNKYILTLVTDIYIYDYPNFSWRKLPNQLKYLRLLHATVYDQVTQKVWVIGSLMGEGKTKTEIIDTNTFNVSDGPELPYPHEKAGCIIKDRYNRTFILGFNDRTGSIIELKNDKVSIVDNVKLREPRKLAACANMDYYKP